MGVRSVWCVCARAVEWHKIYLFCCFHSGEDENLLLDMTLPH
jgi:hypothetical protein